MTAEAKGLNVTPQCGFGIQADQRMAALEGSDKRQWEMLDKVQNRLPVWATMVISLLTFMIGGVLTYAAMK